MCFYWTPSIYMLMFLRIYPSHWTEFMKAGLKGTIYCFPGSTLACFLCFSPTSILFTAVTIWLISLWGIIFAFLLICLTCISVDTRGESKSIYILKSAALKRKLGLSVSEKQLGRKENKKFTGKRIPPIAACFRAIYSMKCPITVDMLANWSRFRCILNSKQSRKSGICQMANDPVMGVTVIMIIFVPQVYQNLMFSIFFVRW